MNFPTTCRTDPRFITPLPFKALMSDPKEPEWPFRNTPTSLLTPTSPEYIRLHQRLDFFTSIITSLINTQTDLINDMLLYACGSLDPHIPTGEKFLQRLNFQQSLWINAAIYLSMLNLETRDLLSKGLGTIYDHLLLHYRLTISTISIWQHTNFSAADMFDMYDILWGDAPNPSVKAVALNMKTGIPMEEVKDDTGSEWLWMIQLRLARRRGWIDLTWEEFKAEWPECQLEKTDESTEVGMKIVEREFFVGKLSPFIERVLKEIVAWEI